MYLLGKVIVAAYTITKGVVKAMDEWKHPKSYAPSNTKEEASGIAPVHTKEKDYFDGYIIDYSDTSTPYAERNDWDDYCEHDLYEDYDYYNEDNYVEDIDNEDIMMYGDGYAVSCTRMSYYVSNYTDHVTHTTKKQKLSSLTKEDADVVVKGIRKHIMAVQCTSYGDKYDGFCRNALSRNKHKWSRIHKTDKLPRIKSPWKRYTDDEIIDPDFNG